MTFHNLALSEVDYNHLWLLTLCNTGKHGLSVLLTLRLEQHALRAFWESTLMLLLRGQQIEGETQGPAGGHQDYKHIRVWQHICISSD